MDKSRLPVLDGRELGVLRLLAMGCPRKVISRDMHIGLRTLDRCLREIKEIFGTHAQGALVVRAIRHRRVSAAYPIGRARARLGGADWVEPNLRQIEAIARIAEGANAVEVGDAIGISATTVRSDVARLATANGAVNLVHLCALAEALRWLDG